MRIQLTKQAVDDLEEARDYYDPIAADLGARFLDNFDQAIARMRMFPRGAPPVEGVAGVRRARMRRFPYGVFYRLVDDSNLQVLRVLNSKRDRSRLPTEQPDT